MSFCFHQLIPKLLRNINDRTVAWFNTTPDHLLVDDKRYVLLR